MKSLRLIYFSASSTSSFRFSYIFIRETKLNLNARIEHGRGKGYNLWRIVFTRFQVFICIVFVKWSRFCADFNSLHFTKAKSDGAHIIDNNAMLHLAIWYFFFLLLLFVCFVRFVCRLFKTFVFFSYFFFFYASFWIRSKEIQLSYCCLLYQMTRSYGSRVSIAITWITKSIFWFQLCRRRRITIDLISNPLFFTKRICIIRRVHRLCYFRKWFMKSCVKTKFVMNWWYSEKLNRNENKFSLDFFRCKIRNKKLFNPLKYFIELVNAKERKT